MMKRLLISLTKEQHKFVKLNSAFIGLSAAKYIGGMIDKEISKNKNIYELVQEALKKKLKTK